MSSVRTATVTPLRRLQGHFRVPGGKPTSYRYALMAALSGGRSELRNYAPDADCGSTLICLATLGVDVPVSGDTVTLMGRGRRSFRSPAGPLDAQNSGTTVRMRTGVLASQPLDTTFAAFWVVTVAATPESVVTLENVGLNPTRSALVGVLRKSAAHVDPRERANAASEPNRTIIVTGDRTGSTHIQPPEVPERIDERSGLAALAAHSGEVRVDDARPLRVNGRDRNYASFFATLDRLVA